MSLLTFLHGLHQCTDFQFCNDILSAMGLETPFLLFYNGLIVIFIICTDSVGNGSLNPFLYGSLFNYLNFLTFDLAQ